jgi:hypothetical protein
MKIDIQIENELIGLPISDLNKINLMMDELKTLFPKMIENIDKISFLTKYMNDGE